MKTPRARSPDPEVAERLVALGGDGEDAALLARGFAQVFVLLCAAQAWVMVRVVPGRSWVGYAVLLTGCAVATFVPAFFRFARVATFGGLLTLAAARFPQTANHLFLQCVIALLLSATRLHEEEEARVLLGALRSLFIGVLFWSGVQKVVHGAYFDGSFLCWNLVRGTHATWRRVAELALPADELANVASARVTGAYRFVSAVGLAASNAVWLTEIACAALLVHPRTRVVGAIAALAVLAGIEVAMSEWVFAAFAANLLVLFTPSRWSTRATRLVRPVFLGWAVLLVFLAGRP